MRVVLTLAPMTGLVLETTRDLLRGLVRPAIVPMGEFIIDRFTELESTSDALVQDMQNTNITYRNDDFFTSNGPTTAHAWNVDEHEFILSLRTFS